MTAIQISDLSSTLNDLDDSIMTRITGGTEPVVVSVPAGSSGITTIVLPDDSDSTVVVVNNINKPSAITTIITGE